MSHSYHSIHEFSSLKVANQKASVSSLSESATLGNAESGSSIVLNSTTGSTLTLPSAILGLNYNVIIAATADAHSINAGSALLLGNVSSATATDGVVMSTGAAKTTLSTTVGSAIGDSFKLISDGTNWYVSGSANTFDAAVFA